MNFSQWKSMVKGLGALLRFVGIYVFATIISTLISFVVLYLIFVGPNPPNFAILTPLVLSPFMGVMLSPVVMYFFDRVFHHRCL
jgi:hypothetical protein